MNVVRCALLAGATSLGPTAAWAQAAEPDSVVYVLSAASQFDVIRARGVTGRIVYHPNAPAESRVEIVVPADSLEVLTPPDTAEIRKVTQAMRTEVLHVDEHPVISFASDSVTRTADGFQIQGRLTLAGQTRDVSCDIRAEVGADTLRATGGFSVKQTDYGIRPFRGGPAGTVRVADRVTFSFDVVGVRTPGP